MKKIILAGGGHGHINILKNLIRNPIENFEIKLITDNEKQYYSGMLAAFMEGIYSEDEISFDLTIFAIGLTKITFSESIGKLIFIRDPKFIDKKS